MNPSQVHVRTSLNPEGPGAITLLLITCLRVEWRCQAYNRIFKPAIVFFENKYLEARPGLVMQGGDDVHALAGAKTGKDLLNSESLVTISVCSPEERLSVNSKPFLLVLSFHFTVNGTPSL